MFRFLLQTALFARILKKQKIGNKSWKAVDLGYPTQVAKTIAHMYLDVHSFIFEEHIYENVDCTLGVINASDLYWRVEPT